MNGPVLILDDDAGVLELTSLYLKARGFSTLTCHSAASALERFQGIGGDLEVLVADVTLSDGSGVEVAVQLEALAPGLKILFVSGYAIEDLSGRDAALYHRLPAASVRFLRKPYSGHELVSKLVELSSCGSGKAPRLKAAPDTLEY
jgi:two-component system cell cycle sensor histidine kinase/response regulator CckA